jgi:SAM-dependent methyltransferase
VSPAVRAAARFRSSRFLSGYAKGKAAWDPAYPAVAKILRGSPRPLLDVGCGIGLLAAYLRECGCEQPVVGIEPDAAKADTARRLVAGHYPQLTFAVGDARDLPEFSGDIVILDVLHYMDPAVQGDVLRAVARRIAPGGTALIRTTFRDGSWRYFATLAEEALVRITGWIRGGRCRFPSRAGVESELKACGLEVSIRPMWGKTPFNSHLVEARRTAGSERVPGDRADK